jgi:two-component system, chemotaxis family, sensor kinase CheA
VDEIVSDFVAESRENLDKVEQELLELEKDPTQAPRIAAIFRAIHTVKGTCGFLDLHRLEAVAHAGENLLSMLRDGIIAFTPTHATAMLDLVDAIRKMIGLVEETGKDGEEPYLELTARLNALAKKTPVAEEKSSVEASAAPPTEPVATPGKPAKAGKMTRVKRNFAKNRAALPSSGEPEAAEAPGPARPEAEAERAFTPRIPAAPVAPPARISIVNAEPPPAPKAEPPAPPKATTTIRVDVAVLDSLMNLVGELVLARNQLLELTSHEVRSPLALTCQRINQVTTDLQGGVMKTRMQPIATVWNKFPRVGRELGVQCGKRIRVDLSGSETELDKSVLEAISEPLAHLIRNAVDHGIESPAKRAEVGKPDEGRIGLNAYHQGGHVLIEISDDGGGIDPERVKRKAIEKGILSDADAQRLSPQEAINLIFAPGFSTAEKVTNISGRGVGMDVVRTNIERIGGSVHVLSTIGAGTTCRVRLPLTLAIVPALIVSSEGQRFAIPQLGLQELVRVRADGPAVEHVHGAPVFRLRGHLLPLIWLGEALELREVPLSQKLSGLGHILVLQIEGGSFGLVVDEVLNSEEIVVKPLSDLLSDLSVYAGSTILGDGQVALILDANNLMARTRAASVKTRRTAAQEETAAPIAIDTTSYVLCAMSGDCRTAVPLAQVERLEKFKVAAIESRGGQAALQYRGQVVPLFRMEDGMSSPSDILDFADDNGLVHALIYREGSQRCAVTVRRILDIVDLADDQAAQRDVLVIDGRITTLTDLGDTVARLAPQWTPALEVAS